MPTELFFIINFLFSIAASIVGLIFSLILIVIVTTHRSCRTVVNLPACSTSVLIAVYFICNLVSSVYGFREEWAREQPACVLKAYFFLMTCVPICYSYLIQAVSRLFFTVFSKRKYLATHRVHWYLIALNWIIGILFSIEPFFLPDGFAYEQESRLCKPTNKNFSVSISSVGIGFVLPLNISIIIYHTIHFHARRSSRRIAPSASAIMTTHIHSARREMKLARNMVMLETVFAASGIPTAIIIFWPVIRPESSPPESLYLLSVNAISLFIALMMIMLVWMNKQLKNIVLTYLHCERGRRHTVSNRQKQLLHVPRH